MAESTERRETALAALLRRRIEEDGPLAFDDFMRLALYHPRAGYYAGATSTRAGPEGDFLTAPTSTPLFGAALARFVDAAWTRLGRPLSWSLVEVGSGTGALASPLLRALKQNHGAAAHGAHVTLVDANPAHRDAARVRMTTDHEQGRWDIRADLPPKIAGPAIVIANELLDNLPVQLLARSQGTWWQRCVGLAPDGSLAFVDQPAPDSLVSWVERFEIAAPDQHQIEVGVGAEAWLVELRAHLADTPAVVLCIDYGETARDLVGEPRPQGTLAAFHGHTQDRNVLTAPGTRDITSHVNWSAVARDATAIGFDVVGYTNQAQFLAGLGLMEDVAKLAAQVDNPASMAAFHAAKEVLLPGGLGDRFKVMALTQGVHATDAAPWRGFENPRPIEPRPRSGS